jgi:hypothetical protein
MSTEAFRAAAFGLIHDTLQTLAPNLPVEYENGPEVDEAIAGNQFAMVELRWYDASVVSVGPRGLGRHKGSISVQVFTKQATGTQPADRLVDNLIELLRSRRIGDGRTLMPQRSVPTYLDGWHKTGVFVPFILDSQ